MGFCKTPTNYWTPEGKFPLLGPDGKVDQNETTTFSMQTVPDQYEILVINFFAPDCKPCILEVPDLKSIYKNIEKKPHIKFVAIGARLTSLSDETVEDAAAIAAEIHQFVRGFKVEYPAYLGTTANLKNYGLTGFPETFVLYRNEKRQWYVKRRYVGVITQKDINPFLD